MRELKSDWEYEKLYDIAKWTAITVGFIVTILFIALILR